MKLNRLQKFSKKIVNRCINAFFIFTATVIICNVFGIRVQEALIYMFGAFVGGELVLLMWGTVTEKKVEVDKAKLPKMQRPAAGDIPNDTFETGNEEFGEYDGRGEI